MLSFKWAVALVSVVYIAFTAAQGSDYHHPVVPQNHRTGHNQNETAVVIPDSERNWTRAGGHGLEGGRPSAGRRPDGDRPGPGRRPDGDRPGPGRRPGGDRPGPGRRPDGEKRGPGRRPDGERRRPDGMRRRPNKQRDPNGKMHYNEDGLAKPAPFVDDWEDCEGPDEYGDRHHHRGPRHRRILHIVIPSVLGVVVLLIIILLVACRKRLAKCCCSKKPIPYANLKPSAPADRYFNAPTAEDLYPTKPQLQIQ